MTTLAQYIVYWDDVAESLQRRVYYFKGIALADEDVRSIAVALAMGGCLLVDLRKRHGQLGSDKEYVHWCKQLHTIDISLFASFLSDVLAVLREVSAPTTYSWFKQQLPSYPVGLLTRPVRRVLESYLFDPNCSDFFYLSQFYSFYSHLNLRSIDHRLGDEYVEFEERLRLQTLPDDIDEYVDIMTSWMEGFSPSDQLRPKHGPGGTANLPRTSHFVDKYRDLAMDDLLWSTLQEDTDDPESYFPYPPHALDRTSKVVFVPKSMKTYRVISKEPTALMYFQQAYRDDVYRYLRTHRFLKKHVTLRDQSGNASMALVGSGDHRFSTIDLSSASDSVTLAMVKKLFHFSNLRLPLVGCRSDYSELPDGRVVEMAKYAPMGSALCFPIQTLIFAAVVECASRHILPGLNYVPWRVYGDDIVVPNCLYDETLRRLESFGFIPNRFKSYSFPARFRESCGMEAYDGCDVTPLKISRRFYSVEKGTLRFHPALYQGLISLANQAKEFQFTVLRAYLIRMIFDDGNLVPLFSREGRGALASTTPDNFRALHACRVDYQVEVVLVDTVTTSAQDECPRAGLACDFRTCPRRSDEQARLFEALRLSSSRTGDMHDPNHLIVVPGRTRPPVIRRRWVNHLSE